MIPLLITLIYRLLSASNPLLSGISPIFSLFFTTEKKDLSSVLFFNLLIDAYLSLHYGLSLYSFLPTLFGLGYYFLSEYGVRSVGFVLGGTIIHYFFTNTLSWITDPFYQKTFNDWLLSNTFGNPLYQPSYIFFLKMALGNAAFYTLFAFINKYDYERIKENIRA